MTPDKINALMSEYISKLTDITGQPPARNTTSTTPQEDPIMALTHTAWMCEQVMEFVKADRRDKAQRWIGFIQGALWCHGIYSIDAMRKHNMPEGVTFRER